MARPFPSLRHLTLAAALLTPAATAFAQPADGWLDRCQRNWNQDRETHCEVREYTISARSALALDGRENGGVTVIGSDRRDILVRARIQVEAADRSAAQAIAREVGIDTAPGRISAQGPRTERRESWSVSYEVLVPRHIDITAYANNGGLTVEGVEGRINLETVNGGIHLREVAGAVQGRTSNGGITVVLDGTEWKGSGLDLRTTNGGVTMDIPANYNAALETGTYNGSLTADFPLTVQGDVGRRITTELGRGGASIRATTSNGSVRLRRM